MKKPRKTVRPVPAAFDYSSLLAGGLIVVAIILSYANALQAPFIFDDGPGIEQNESIRSLWPLGPVLHPPTDRGTSVAGRPIVNLSLAVNYALSGVQPWSYHAVNILIHALAALTMFGLTRRTLVGPVLHVPDTGMANRLAGVVALLWAIHPLQTESVTCVIQRTESLVGLFYLLTLYFFARATTTTGSARLGWSALSITACALGMGTKEVMVTAPVLALLYDRTFISGSFRGIARNRWLHYGLISTWVLLLYLLQGNPLRGGTAGYDDITWWRYLLTQCRAVELYLQLALWPHPLVLDYGTAVVPDLLAVWWQAALLLALVAGTAYALWRQPVLGFLGAWFFLILAPSSSVVPLVTQTIAEHRVYLSLAAIIAGVAGVLAFRAPRYLLPAGLGLALLFGGLTIRRNQLYHSPERLWRDNLARQPDNIRVHVGLAGCADQAGRFAEAAAHYENYLRRKPNDPDVRFNYARDLVKVGRRTEAGQNFESVLHDQPVNIDARVNYGANLIALGQMDEAVRQFEITVQLDGKNAGNHFNLAETLAKAGRFPEALPHYEQAVRLKPEAAFMHYRHGDALRMAGRTAEGVTAYRTAVTIQPDLFPAWTNLGVALMNLGRRTESIQALETALRLKPDDPAAQNNLDYARSQGAR